MHVAFFCVYCTSNSPKLNSLIYYAFDGLMYDAFQGLNALLSYVPNKAFSSRPLEAAG